jgi:hypothetical protein
MYKHLKYKRGYLICDGSIEPPFKHWGTQKINKYYIYFDPLNETFFKQDGENLIFILGSMIDIDAATSDKDFIGSKLLSLFNESEEHFFEYLDVLAGRYLILYGTGSHLRILADATGMRTIFYAKHYNLIGSHCHLLNEYINSKPSSIVNQSWLSEYTSYHLPGHFTPYEEIFFLTPNTLLEIPEKKIRRFYPRKNIEMKSISEVTNEISRLINVQLNELSKSGMKFLLSLSAGIDSRISLSLTKSYRDKFLYFTYSKANEISRSADILKVDEEVVSEMVENLGLNHKFLTIDMESEDEDFKSFSEALYKNAFTNHSHKLAKLYYENFSDNYLHIRSNILEIGRAFYKKKVSYPKEMGINEMAKCYAPKAANDEKVKNAFSIFYNEVDFGNIYNYDPYDIFYWEFRMGVWHSQLLLESDVAHDTYILFNARKILDLLLSVPFTDRKENNVFHETIKKNWPILQFWMINKLENLTLFYDEQFDEFGMNLKDNLHFSTTSNGNSEIPVFTKVQKNRAKFFIDKSNPLKDDALSAELELNTIPNESYQCILHLRSPYENKKRKGRMVYQVHLNDNLLLEEDISYWKETNLINIKWIPEDSHNKLKITVKSIKNCEDWSWGRAGTILIERVTLRKTEDTANLDVTVSSPYSTLFPKN